MSNHSYVIEVASNGSKSWGKWEQFTRVNLGQTRKAVRSYERMYPHYKFRIIKVTTTREIVK